jgi:hypothetical protein
LTSITTVARVNEVLWQVPLQKNDCQKWISDYITDLHTPKSKQEFQ